jgi:hypothetical protein
LLAIHVTILPHGRFMAVTGGLRAADRGRQPRTAWALL